MYHITERNERHGRRHALVLAITLHLAFGAMLYFKTIKDTASHNSEHPTKVNVAKEPATARARTVQLP